MMRYSACTPLPGADSICQIHPYGTCPGGGAALINAPEWPSDGPRVTIPEQQGPPQSASDPRSDPSPLTRRPLVFVSMSDVKEREMVWLLPGLLPREDVTVLVGEEGIGKGLWWVDVVRRVQLETRVLVIAAEDDPERHLRPRMEAAGVDPDRVTIAVRDARTLTGCPSLPDDIDQIESEMRRGRYGLLIVDPWVSVVPGRLSLKDTQQARDALDPLTELARRSGAAILLVAHTNRGGGSLRDRVSLTAALRQAARVLVHAIEDPEDQTLLVGVEKSNASDRGPASRYRKSGTGQRWRVQHLEDTTRDIRSWDRDLAALADGRATDRWSAVRSAAEASGGMITRSQIIDAYGGSDDAADKAIGRWIKSGRLVREPEKGVYSVSAE